MSGKKADVGDKEKNEKKDGEDEDDEEGRSSTDKLRGSGVEEHVLEDVGTGKGKEIVVQTRASDDEKSGEYAMKEGLGDEEIALILLTRNAINPKQLALEMIQRIMREKGSAGVKLLLPAFHKFITGKAVEEVLIVSAGEVTRPSPPFHTLVTASRLYVPAL